MIELTGLIVCQEVDESECVPKVLGLLRFRCGRFVCGGLCVSLPVIGIIVGVVFSCGPIFILELFFSVFPRSLAILDPIVHQFGYTVVSGSCLDVNCIGRVAGTLRLWSLLDDARGYWWVECYESWL